MLKRRGWVLGLILVLVIGAAGLSFRLLPSAVGALPGRVRQYIPAPVGAVLVPPPPAALPVPHPRDIAPVQLAADVVSPPTPEIRPSITPISAAIKAQDAPGRPGQSSSDKPAVLPSNVTRVAEPLVEKLPPYVRLNNVPIVGQKFNNCGPTNLSIVLNYWAVEVDQFDVSSQVRPNYEDRNVSPYELRDYVLATTGLEAAVYSGGDLALLKGLLATGLPVIVEKGLHSDEVTGWMGHYVTLAGYDDVAHQFLVRDTFQGPWEEDGRVAYDALLQDWHAFNNTLVVVFQPDQALLVAKAVGEERVYPEMMWSQAANVARKAITANPDDAFGWFNLGSSLVEMARLSDDMTQWQQAAAAYDQARLLGLPPRMLWYQFGPYEAYLAVNRPEDALALAEATLSTQGGRNVEETYLYKGLALKMLGDGAGATVAFSKTEALNPGSKTAVGARQALLSGN